MMYLGLVDLGFGSSVQKYMAEFAAHGAEAKIGRLLSTTLIMFSGLGLVLLILAFVVSPLIGTVFQISAGSVAEARTALIMMGLVQGIGLPLGVFNGALIGLQRMDLNNMISVAGTGVIVLIVVKFVNAGWGLPGICSAYLIVTLLSGMVLSLRPAPAAGSAVVRLRIRPVACPHYLHIRPHLFRAEDRSLPEIQH